METLRAALAIVRIAELELDEKAPILPVKCSHYLIAADADLLIVPANASAVGNHHAVENIMCLSRCDALMVYVARPGTGKNRSEEHTSELQSLMRHHVCRLLLEKKKKT